MSDFQRFEENNLELVLNGKRANSYLLNEFKLNSDVNKHTKLKIELEISRDNNSLYEEVTGTKDCRAEVYLNKKIDEKKTIRVPLFNGVIYKSKIHNYGNMGMRFSLKAKSKSVLLDREEKYRVFQDTEMSFREVVNIVMKDYSKDKINIFMDEKADVKIGGLLVQFEETDWEFLIRIASHLGTGMVVTKASEITFGFVDVYPSVKEEDMYFADYDKVLNGDYVEYEVYSSQVFNSGEIIHMKTDEWENNFVIRKSEVEFRNSVFLGEYIFVANDGFKVKKKYNEKLRGSVIEARVEKIFSREGIAVMHVTFEEGLKKLGIGYKDYGNRRFVIPYTTYYSQTNEGFFCTSEVGDVVNVVFWNRDENHVRVCWSTNNPGNGRFSDYTKRTFHVNNTDFRFILDTDKFDMSSNSRITSKSDLISEEAKSITEKAEEVVSIDSGSLVSIEAKGEIEGIGGTVNIEGNTGEVIVKAAGDVRLKGTKVLSN